MSALTLGGVAGRLDDVRARIENAGGDLDRIVIVAVTKGFGPDAPSIALELGLDHLGESYAQELLGKVEAVHGRIEPRWQFIGRLQTNKVRSLAPHVATWQSVDRASVVAEIAKRAPGASVFVQVNLTDESTKGGCAVDGLPDLVDRARVAGLRVDGLMAMGVAGDDRATAAAFERAVDLADRHDLVHRSIGMSGDLEIAVRAGSTMIRVGTDLFGPRPAP